MTDEGQSFESKLSTFYSNVLIAGGAGFIDDVTNPAKNAETILDQYGKLIYQAYEKLGATPLGDAIPEYAWYSSDVLRLMTWYCTIRIIMVLKSSRSVETQRRVSLVAALIPAVLYEIGQLSSFDPKDIAAYVIGVTIAYFLDKKVSEKLADVAFDKP